MNPIQEEMYDVYVYEIVRCKVVNVRAPSSSDALNLAADRVASQREALFMRNCEHYSSDAHIAYTESAEEISCAAILRHDSPDQEEYFHLGAQGQWAAGDRQRVLLMTRGQESHLECDFGVNIHHHDMGVLSDEGPVGFEDLYKAGLANFYSSISDTDKCRVLLDIADLSIRESDGIMIMVDRGGNECKIERSPTCRDEALEFAVDMLFPLSEWMATNEKNYYDWARCMAESHGRVSFSDTPGFSMSN